MRPWVIAAALATPQTCTHPLCSALEAFSNAELRVDATTHRGLNELKSSLVQHNYTASNVARALGSSEVYGFDPAKFAVCDNKRCQPLTDPHNAKPLDIIIMLLLRINLEVYMSPPQGVPRKAAERVIGTRAVKALIKLKVLHETHIGGPGGTDTHLHSLVQLVPYDTVALIATDFFQVATEFWKGKVEPVMSLGLDSDGLALGAPRQFRSKRLLDLCTGSGVQAIVAASHYAEDVTLVDVSPRAARFARFNLLLNGIGPERSRVYVGSLYDALPSGTQPFDTILANPPYLPEPVISGSKEGHLALYGAGGPQGHLITSQIVGGAGHWLTQNSSGATLRIVATIYNVDRYREWVSDWWRQGATSAAEVTLFTGQVWSREHMNAQGMMATQGADIHDGCNALLWIRQRASAGDHLHHESATRAEVTFQRSLLHPYMWHILRSEVGLRDLIQFLLRNDPAALLPSYGDFTNWDTPSSYERLKGVWTECAASLQVGWVGSVNTKLRALPSMLQERLLVCVHSGL